MEIAKLFKNGRSQAVRIPKKYRIAADLVEIRQQGDSIVLTPRKKVSWDDFFNNYTCPDFELDRDDVQEFQPRECFE